MLFPLNLSPPIPILCFIELGLERVIPPDLYCSGPLHLEHMRLKLHRLRLVTFGLEPFRLHFEDTSMILLLVPLLK